MSPTDSYSEQFVSGAANCEQQAISSEVNDENRNSKATSRSSRQIRSDCITSGREVCPIISSHHKLPSLIYTAAPG